MLSCQNPQCQNPFNPDTNKYCHTCGSSQLSELFRHRYRVIKVLGEGGFGKTYLTEDADRLDSPCVIKQFAPQVTGTAELQKSTELFKHEARQLYELGENHSQIPRLNAYFEYGTSLYLVQEFIQGDNLLTELKQKPYTEQQIREFLTDLLPVLDFIHTSNVIHRDIKPDNIIRRQPDKKLVLIDFGGAKQITQTNLARQGTGIYTPGYAPTEQMSGRAIPASDLYALGVTCVRLLTQCLPIFNVYGEIDNDIYDAVNLEWLWRQRLQTMSVTISNELAAILDKLLIHAPRERYQTAQEVLRDLNSSPSQQRIPTTIVVTPPIFPSSNSPSLSTGRGQGGGVPLKTFQFDVVTVDSQGNISNRQRHQAEYLPENLGNGVTLDMVSLPGGSFLMGSPDTEEGRYDNETPQHKVKISPFLIGKTPVTQAQWKAVAALPQINQKLDLDPSRFKGANRPVENVSWNDAIEFCARLTKKTGRKYRLPSEAEWEYACRAGTTTPFHFGETISPEIANYEGNYAYGSGKKGKYRQETTVVGSFQVANAFGLYDMHGNVWEWCADFWHENYYDAPTDGSVWEFGGT
ncbi:bifunctional serine/threonine-protein kinase/formylglycine-generating enzyme family protein [Crinalium epipsammum]|uniref:bifunctional serine/threonine-protein kinase/formylglycine-generating enzyme family protein n=1 Tax=Crinalium epipsammum TaxID=241425 RepID=UPI0002E33F53|nr:bifunctional serine/threonine-protein kinase/formylglycine-generating enzyme family protein [Crinalium epipsammum]